MSMTIRQRTTERQYQEVVQFATRFACTEEVALEWLICDEWDYYEASLSYARWVAACNCVSTMQKPQ